MTTETFFANFGHLADAPNGVKKLRELILQLAVRGKLVPQDPNDEPASVLLERIRKEKAVKISRRGEKFFAPTNPVIPDETPYELPQGWERVFFGDIAQHNAGKTLDKGRNTGRLRDYITTSNLYWGHFDLNNVRKMPIEDGELERCTARKRDLLIVEGGEAGRAAVWTENYDICFQNHIHRARFYCDIDPFYVCRFFEKLNLSGEISQYRKGVGISNMSGKALASIVLPLPPLAEQKRIVNKVDQLMALCDELETHQKKQQQGRVRLNNASLDKLLTAREPDLFADHWQRICTNFDLLYDHPETIAKLRSAILQLAVQGKLVSQDPNDEPASVLLERVRMEKKKILKAGKAKSPKFLTDVKIVYQNLPESWRETRLGDLTIFGPQNGYSPRPVDHETKTKSLTLSATTKGYFNPLCFKFVDEDFEKNSSLWLEAGDILIQRGNSLEYVGIGAVYQGRRNEFIYPDLMMKVRVSQGIDIGFAHLVINCNISRDFFQGNASGTSGSMPKVNQAVVNSLPFPLPPEAEQHRIVAKVDQLMVLCDELEVKLNHAQHHIEKLMEATVQKLLVA